jgi:DNA (cytosine-5)-methyltransferase 1
LAPRFVLIENVKGFFGGRNSAARYIQERLDDINRRGGWKYATTTFALNAADYGVAQRRERVFAVIDRLGSDVAIPPPTHANDPMTAWEAIGDLVNRDDEYPSGGTWAGLLPSIPEGGNYQFLTARGGGPELFGYRTRYWSFLLKLARDQPSWTLPASPGPDTGPFHWDNRHLTVRERLRIQSFPDSWELSGSLRTQIRQVGNATPPALAEAVGKQIFDLLLEPTRPRVYALHGIRRRDIPSPVLPIPVSSDYARYAGPKFAHPGTGAGPGRKRPATPDSSR